jgi:hypothetical protein
VIQEKLWYAARSAPFFLEDFAEKRHVGIGVVARSVHILEPQKIGFRFSAAAELEKGEWYTEV